MKNINERYLYVIGILQYELESLIKETGIKSLIIKIDSLNSILLAAISQPVCTQTNTLLLGRTFHENKDLEKLAKFYTTDFKFINLENIKNIFFNEINYNINIFETEKLLTNTQRLESDLRIESTYLYNLSNYYDGIILGSLDYTNFLLGNYIPNLDLADFNLLLYLWKSEIHDLVNYYINTYKLNNEIIFKNLNKILDKDKYCSIFEEDISYIDIDKLFIKYSKDEKFENHEVIQKYLNNWIKRSYPLAIDRKLFNFKGDD